MSSEPPGAEGGDPQRRRETGADIEIDMRQQIGLVQQHQVGSGKHARIFQGLVFPFGHRQHHDFMRLAKIEGGGADEIADILDEQ